MPSQKIIFKHCGSFLKNAEVSFFLVIYAIHGIPDIQGNHTGTCTILRVKNKSEVMSS